MDGKRVYSLLDLEKMSASDALQLAGFGHRSADRLKNQGRREIFSLQTSETVAELKAEEAFSFAFVALNKAAS